jgi:hypothetical protein
MNLQVSCFSMKQLITFVGSETIPDHCFRISKDMSQSSGKSLKTIMLTLVDSETIPDNRFQCCQTDEMRTKWLMLSSAGLVSFHPSYLD